MKTTKILFLGIAICTSFYFSQSANATEFKAAEQQPISKIVTEKDSTLSGINLYPDVDKRSFLLEFTQKLTEPAVLEMSDEAGNIVYTKKLVPTDKNIAKPMKVGKLKSGIYLIEVKTSDTTYWTELKVSL